MYISYTLHPRNLWPTGVIFRKYICTLYHSSCSEITLHGSKSHCGEKQANLGHIVNLCITAVVDKDYVWQQRHELISLMVTLQLWNSRLLEEGSCGGSTKKIEGNGRTKNAGNKELMWLPPLLCCLMAVWWRNYEKKEINSLSCRIYINIKYNH